jgi:hypothetical protein
MIEPFIEKYTATILDRPTLNLSKWYSPITGTIRRLSARAPNLSIGTHIFNVSKNGVYLYAIGSAFSLTGSGAAEKADLAISVAKGDALVWDYVSAGAGTVAPPLFFEIDIEPNDVPGRRETIAFETGSLADDATENADVALGSVGLIRKITADRSTRIRLYTTATHRTADAARPIGTDPEDEHGVQMDLYLTPGNLVWDFAQAIPFFDGQSTPTGIVKAAVQNLSGSTSAVAIDFDVTILED